jgi:hypothetical protein
MSDNRLQGPLPPLANLSQLQTVSFSNNQLTGGALFLRVVFCEC